MATLTQYSGRGCLALIAAAILAIGCTAETDRPSGSDSGLTEQTDAQADDVSDAIDVNVSDPVAGCDDGIVQECRVELPETAGVKNCAVGLQLCQDGQWTDCSRPEEIEAMLDAE